MQRLVEDMVLHIARKIGGAFVAADCIVEAIVLTGEWMQSVFVRNALRKRIVRLAPVQIYRGSMDMEGLGSDSPMGDLGGGGDGGEVARLIRELDARVGQLEAKLGESNEARERLERQVAAQAEELRVQRAAIARTQRALRGMNKSEEEATAPALRDPKAGPQA